MSLIEKKHVRDIYNKIAEHFSITRAYQWPGIKQFIDDLPKNSFIADIGCGNGKNMINENHTFVGMDFSIELAKICVNKGKNCILGTNINIPFRNNIFDATISVAVIHHLSEEYSRRECVKELIRITKPGGLIFIQVWSFEDKDYDNQDAYVKWTMRKTGKIYKRYYHLFVKNELEEIVPLKDVIILKSFEEHGNYCVILKKK